MMAIEMIFCSRYKSTLMAEVRAGCARNHHVGGDKK
jgi:hypothetical protein